jgi:hypothetical protein
MHKRINDSFSRVNKFRSMIELNHEETKAEKQKEKIKQFENFYFFTFEQKKKKKEEFESKKAKFESQQLAKTLRLNEMSERHKITLEKIGNVTQNHNNILLERDEKVKEKQQAQAIKLEYAKIRRKKMHDEFEEKGYRILSKQLDSFEHSHYKGEIVELQSQASK